MNLRLLFVQALCAGIQVQSQVVFDLPGCIPAWGSSQDRQYWFHADRALTLPTSGTNVVWDLDALTLFTTPMVMSCVDPATTPCASSFPEATHATDIVINGMGQWNFFRSTGDQLFQIGAYDPALSGPETCPNPLLIGEFPLEFDEEWTDTLGCTHGFGVSSDVYQLHVVATGTILYPGGSITDVAMVQRAGYGGTYIWYTQDDYLRPLGNYRPGQYMRLYVPAGEHAMADHAEAPGIRLFPIPASDHVRIELDRITDLRSLSLVAADGRRISLPAPQGEGPSFSIDLGLQAPGMYFLEVGGTGWRRRSALPIFR